MGQPISRQHVPALDGVRGLAILLVIGFHGGAAVLPDDAGFLGTVRHLLGFGLHGVDLFFVLSGYLITGILLDTRDGPAYFRPFYWRRALRIFPAYYAYLAVVFLGVRWAFLRGGGDPWADVRAWPYLVYVQNWTARPGPPEPLLGHLWSLAVEEQFYLVWPAVVYVVPRRRLPAVCAVLAAGALALRCLLALRGNGVSGAHNFTPARLDALLLGALLALAIRDGAWLAWCRTWVPRLGWSAFAALLVLARPTDGFDFFNPLVYTVGWSLVALVSAALVFCAATARRGPLVAAFSWGWLRTFGRYSYAIYLVHPLIYQLLPYYWRGYLVGRSPAVFSLGLLVFPAVVALASLALAWLSWHLLEGPLLRLKDRVPYGRG